MSKPAPSPAAQGGGSKPSNDAAPAGPAVPAPIGAVPDPSLIKPNQPFSALVLGASGATGRSLVSKLANNPRVNRIGLLVRSNLPADYFGVLLPANQNKINQTVIDFEKLSESKQAFEGYDSCFCCLGSTRSKAGSKAAFYHIDFDYITQSSALAKLGGIKHFNLVSSSGADHKSFFHYMRTKGQIEQNLINEVSFPSLAIFRPGLLLTDRPGESRLGEWFAQKILPALHFMLPEKSKGVYVQTVAEAMMVHTEYVLARKEKDAAEFDAAPKSRIFENDDIRLLRVAKL